MASRRKLKKSEVQLKPVKVNVAIQTRYKRSLQASNVAYKKQVDKASTSILAAINKLDRSKPGAFQKQKAALERRIGALERNLAAANKRSRKAVDRFVRDMEKENKRRLGLSTRGKVDSKLAEFLIGRRKKSLDKKINKIRNEYHKNITEANQDYSTRVQSVLFEKLANPAIDAKKRIRGARGIVTRRIKNTSQNQAHALNASINKTTQTAIGINAYRWQNKEDNLVRASHKHPNVNRKIFKWTEPPVETGGLHPGEDYGCRCIAIPIADKKVLAAMAER